MVYEELYGNEWHRIATKELEGELEKFKVSWTKSKEDYIIEHECEREQSLLFNSAEESLQQKKKGSRISFHERVHLYRIMKQNKKSKAWISIDYNISLGTLHNIVKEFETPIQRLHLERSITSRNLIESPKLREKIESYLLTNRTPWTAKNISYHLLSEMGVAIPKRVVREILIKMLGMKYKKGLSRLVSFNEEKNILSKQWFAIRLWKVLDQFDMLVNVDESSFSRLTKKCYSWIPKGKQQIIKNIWFLNSWSLVTAITSTGSVMAAKSDKSVNSELFVNFMKELVMFIKEREGCDARNCLVIMDNASVHRAEITKQYLWEEGINIAFIPQYSPEMAPIEHYFAKLKQSTIEMSKGRNINWRSTSSNALIRKWMETIPAQMVRNIWTSFTNELNKSIDLL